MASCSTAKIISAYISTWVDWWPGNEHTAEAIWAKIGKSGESKVHKDVSKVIGADFFVSIWTTRNDAVFKRGFKKVVSILVGTIGFVIRLMP